MLNADTREFTFTSEFDGLDISAVIAVPSGSINGIVQIVHGMNEYKERYFPFMDYLASEGFISVIHDNRGHGKSICKEDDLGFMYRNGGKGFVEDIAQLTRRVRANYPTYPYFLMGHSMGSLGARCFLKEHDAEINGLIVMGCPCYSRFSGFARSIDSAVSKRLGSRFRSEKIYEISEKTLNKQFTKAGETTPRSWICSDKEVVSTFNSDPLCNFRYTLNGYECLLWLMRETYSKKGWRVANPKLPIRFISGKDDPCMLSEKKFFEAMSVLEKAGYTSISHRFFDGMRHEVLNEKNSMNVYKDIAKTLYSWIDRLQELAVEIHVPEGGTGVPVVEEAPQAAPATGEVPEAITAAAQTAIPADADVFDILEAVQPDGTAPIMASGSAVAPQKQPSAVPQEQPAESKVGSEVLEILESVPESEYKEQPAEEPQLEPAEQVKAAAAEVLDLIEAAESGVMPQ